MKLDDRTDTELHRLVELVRSRRMVNMCGLRIEIHVDGTLPPGTAKLVCGPRPEQQVTITGLDT